MSGNQIIALKKVMLWDLNNRRVIESFNQTILMAPIHKSKHVWIVVINIYKVGNIIKTCRVKLDQTSLNIAKLIINQQISVQIFWQGLLLFRLCHQWTGQNIERYSKGAGYFVHNVCTDHDDSIKWFLLLQHDPYPPLPA